MKFVDICELYKVIQKKRICIFGAGKAGSTMFSFLKMHNCRYLFIADNDTSKHGIIDEKYEIGSFDKSLEMQMDIYLVGFLNNDIEKIKSVVDFLYDRGISTEKVRCINFESEWVNDFCAEYTKQELRKLKINIKGKKNPERIVLVGTLYNENDKDRIMGGTTGAVNMQRSLLGN